MDKNEKYDDDDEDKERVLRQVLNGEKCLRTTILETIGTKAFRLLGEEFVQTLPDDEDQKERILNERDRNEFMYYILNYVRDGTRCFLMTKEKNEDESIAKEKTSSENRTSTTEESTNKKNVWNQKRRITITRVSPDKGFPRNPLFSGTSEIEDGRKVDLAITKKRSESLSEALVSPRRVVDVTQKLTPRKVLTPQKLNLLSTPKRENDAEEEEEYMSDDRRRRLERLAYLYSALLLTRRVPNILVELHLIVRLLTCNLRNGTMSSSTKSNAKIFSCKADCTFFGALVIVSIHPIVIGFGRRFVYVVFERWCSSECVTVSRLRHRPTRHSFISQENHSKSSVQMRTRNH